MSPLLLDTHVLVWLVEGDQRLAVAVRDQIERSREASAVCVSAITPWEVALLVAKGKIQFGRDVGEWVDAALALPGIRLAPLLPLIAVASTRLPWEAHPDPADRILIATARHLNAALVTADRRILDYARQGFMRCLPAE
jgi:PIN domain nuclease of toxin-antitoxin system